jgi:hypothetical protein
MIAHFSGAIAISRQAFSTQSDEAIASSSIKAIHSEEVLSSPALRAMDKPASCTRTSRTPAKRHTTFLMLAAS